MNKQIPDLKTLNTNRQKDEQLPSQWKAFLVQTTVRYLFLSSFFKAVWLTKIKVFDPTYCASQDTRKPALSEGYKECKAAVCMGGNSTRSIKSFDSRAHWPINPTALEWVPQTYSDICMQSWVYKAIHCSTVYNNRRLETAWMSIKRGLLRQIAIHPKDGNLYGC